MSAANKSSVNYAKFRHNNKPKYNLDIPSLLPDQDTKQFSHEQEFGNLFSHMNKDNLDYIKKEIRQKKRKKNHNRAKSTVSDGQSEKSDILRSQRKIYKDPFNKIIQLQPYQEETPRLSHNSYQRENVVPHSHQQKQDELIHDTNQQDIKQQRQEQEVSESQFVICLDQYLECLKKPAKKKRKSPKKSFKKHNHQQDNLNTQILKKSINILQKKYRKQMRDNAFLAKQLEQHKRNQQIDKNNLHKLRQHNEILLKEQKLLKQRCKDLEKIIRDKESLNLQKNQRKIDYNNENSYRSPYQQLYDMMRSDRNKEQRRSYSKFSSNNNNSIQKLKEQYHEYMKLNSEILKRPQNPYYIKK